ncbi:MAG: O-antigen ligase family protein [Dehalococcoidia bacterium]|nr:O-antigen ligase family protein [Dehalococcoidia bacterium]
MTAATYRRDVNVAAALLPPALMFGALAAALVASVALLMMGLWAVVLPIYAAFAIAAVLWPYPTVAVVLCLATVIEPPSFDFTRVPGELMYLMPPGWSEAFVITTSPMELVVLLAAGVVVLRGQGTRPPLPLLVWAAPLALLLGMAYGFSRGSDRVLVYHEARGFILAIAIFVLASRVRLAQLQVLAWPILLSTAALAVISLLRYAQFMRDGTSGIPIEAAYAHETPVYLAIGLVLAAGIVVRGQQSNRRRAALILYALLLFFALIATGRRAGTLVLLTSTLTFAVLTFRHRPLLILSAGLVAGALMAGYLGAYWNKEYGALAQPARAIRSQFDPSERDRSSDEYRVMERQNVMETIRLNRVFGVGFGQPFIQFRPLPDLTSFWPLQSYVPHQNVLWLWLKLGIFGITVFLGVTVLALRRALWSVRGMSPSQPGWLLALVVAATILMYLAFATVDIAFTSTRAIAPLAIALGLAFQLPGQRREVAP